MPSLTVHTTVANFVASLGVGTNVGVSVRVIRSGVGTTITRTGTPVNCLSVRVLGSGTNVTTVGTVIITRGGDRYAVTSATPSEGTATPSSASRGSCEVTTDVTFAASCYVTLAGPGSPTVTTGSRDVGTTIVGVGMSAGSGDTVLFIPTAGTTLTAAMAVSVLCNALGLSSTGTTAVATVGTLPGAIYVFEGSTVLSDPLIPGVLPVSIVDGNTVTAKASIDLTSSAAVPLSSTSDPPDITGIVTVAVK